MSTNFEGIAQDVPQSSVEIIEEPHPLNTYDVGRRFAVRTTLVLGIATSLIATEAVVVAPPPAEATTGGYPDAGAHAL